MSSQPSAEWPWYAFLYRFFGPSGTFWLWMLCLALIWIYGGEAYVAMLNRHPVPRSVANAASGQELTRYWVQLQGLELKDARKLLGEVGQSGAPVRLLLDEQDPATQRWQELSNLAFELRSEKSNGIRSRVAVVKKFELLMSQFQRERERYIPTQSIRLYQPGDVALVSSDCNIGQPSGRVNSSAKTPEQLVLEAQRDFVRAVKLVDENVRPNVEFQGLLDTTPKSLRNRVYEELKIGLSTQTLRINRRPYFLPLWIVGAAFTLMVFLAAGLLTSATRRDESLESSALPSSDQDEA